ncbi:uncharacterized protein LOC128667346 [Microplitis demolitor]|uniref:uncharacterized protein LOC128667346 n=1 Tax=Microplitis demolitor TaxID=69319 RepID=UPI00235B60D6|nr:uncharacterized protein LOC128667346 [Microplitis demolitor]
MAFLASMIASVVGGAEFIIFDDDDADEKNEKLIKVVGYAKNIVPRYSDKQFQHHFRMTPETFESFLQKLHSIIPHDFRSGHTELPLEEQAMILIWYLGNCESFRSVANRFDISKSTCWEVLYRTCNRVLQMNQYHNILCWPSQTRAREIIDGFRRINNFPGIIGAIDGSHIPIKKPSEYGNSYINRKSFASVLLQGVCDHNKLFIDVYAGQPGSIHDATLFKKSDLYERIQRNEVNFPDNSHMIGDLAYPLCSYLLVGFKNTRILTQQEINYNYKLSKQRVVIENAFALLKGRFRRLLIVETVRLDLIALLIVTACILHNICILSTDILDIDVNSELEEEEGLQLNNGDDDFVTENEVTLRGIRKRNAIVEIL